MVFIHDLGIGCESAMLATVGWEIRFEREVMPKG